MREYDVVAKYHNGETVLLFSGEYRKVSEKKMGQYVSKYGFTIEDKGKKSTIADVLLREREQTGEVISVTPYIKIFDEHGRRRK